MFELNYFYVRLSMKEDWRVVSGEIDVILDLVLLLANCVDLSQILNRFFSININSKYILNCRWLVQPAHLFSCGFGVGKKWIKSINRFQS